MPTPTTSDSAPQLLDPRFAQALRDMYQWWIHFKQYPRPYYRPPDIQTPEVFVAYSPSGGLPALEYVVAGDASEEGLPLTVSKIVPGYADCDLYRLLQDSAGGGFLQGMPLGLTQLVYNLGEMIPGHTPFLAIRDKAGTWWACCQGKAAHETTGTGTGSGSGGTGTGTGGQGAILSFGQGVNVQAGSGAGLSFSVTAHNVKAGSLLIAYFAGYGSNITLQIPAARDPFGNVHPMSLVESANQTSPIDSLLSLSTHVALIAGDYVITSTLSQVSGPAAEKAGHLIVVEVQGLLSDALDRHLNATGLASQPDTGTTTPTTAANEYAGSCFALMDPSTLTWSYGNAFSSGSQDCHSTVQGVECYTTEGLKILTAAQAVRSTLGGTTPAGWAAVLGTWK